MSICPGQLDVRNFFRETKTTMDTLSLPHYHAITSYFLLFWKRIPFKFLLIGSARVAEALHNLSSVQTPHLPLARASRKCYRSSMPNAWSPSPARTPGPLVAACVVAIPA